jgi:hypothetical protein
MKKLFTLFYFYTLVLSLTLAGFQNSLLTIAVGQSAETQSTGPSLCTDCDNNKLLNWSFESGVGNWNTVKSGSSAVELKKESQYAVCGSSAAAFSGYGYFYQDVAGILPGSVATLKVYAGRSTDYNQRIQIIFLDATGQEIPNTTKTVKVDKNVTSSPSGLKLYTLTSGEAPAGTAKIRIKGIQDNNSAWMKVDAVCLTIQYCEDCENNKLVNGSFESGTTGWFKSAGSLAVNSTYAVCGDNGATFNGNGYFYQDVAGILPGSIATLKIWGARHEDYGQKFQIVFLNASGGEISSSLKSVTIGKDVDVAPWGLNKYTLTSDPAPAGTAKIRVKGIQSNSNAWIKVDQACLTIKYCEECVGNRLTNPSFESGMTGWDKSGGSLENNPTYAVCGDNAGTFSGNGYFYQDVSGVIEGSIATLKIWGARHDDYSQKFQIVFLNSAGGEISSSLKSVAITKNVNTAPWGLSQYTITSDPAPAGTAKVRVKGIQNNNNAWIKVDQACLTITDPCGCDGNKLANGSFESGTSGWEKSEGTNFTEETASKGCGSKYGVITGTGSIYQEFNIAGKSKINLIIWGGTDDVSKDHKFKIIYYKAGNVVINTGNANETVEMDYAMTNNYLKQFTFLISTAPDAAIKVRIEAVAASGTTSKFKIDAGCLRITPPDGPLPVTLTDFTVTNEKSTATLTWATTSETNASEFEVQHSENGKVWNKIGAVSAAGESVRLERYHFVHEGPSDGDNFYRLKMVDVDNTYAMSRIVRINFENAAAVQVYPNPTSDFMKLTLGKEKILHVQLYNIQGVMVLENKPGASDILDIRHLNPGSYIVKIKQISGMTSTRRIQVVR